MALTYAARKLCDRVSKSVDAADEQVPKYSDASLQVPYNQQLGAVVSGVAAVTAKDSGMVL
jgi:hypothetical protein